MSEQHCPGQLYSCEATFEGTVEFDDSGYWIPEGTHASYKEEIVLFLKRAWEMFPKLRGILSGIIIWARIDEGRPRKLCVSTKDGAQFSFYDAETGKDL